MTSELSDGGFLQLQTDPDASAILVPSSSLRQNCVRSASARTPNNVRSRRFG